MSLKKLFLGFLVLTTLALGAQFAHVYASRGTGGCSTTGPLHNQFTISTGSTPDDEHYFPFGFLCGGDNNDTTAASFNGSPAAGKTNSPPKPILINSNIHFSGSFSPSGPAKITQNQNSSEVLVWVTIDGPSALIADSSISGEGSGVKSTPCPGTSGRYPGTVYNNRDLPSGSRYTDGSLTNGNQESPAAYNPNKGTGFETCLTQGKMVYWRNASGGTNYSFDLQLKNNRTAPANNPLCVRMNVSVRFSPGESLFPSAGSSLPYPDVDNVASHVAKQSEQRCYEVYNNTPGGSLTLSCTGYSIYAYDPDDPGSPDWKIVHTSGGQVVDAGGTNRNASGGGTFDENTDYYLKVRDMNDGNWYTVDGPKRPSCSVAGTASCQTFGDSTVALGSDAHIQVEYHNDAADPSTNWNNVGWVWGGAPAKANWNPAGYNALNSWQKQHSGIQTFPGVKGGTSGRIMLHERYQNAAGVWSDLHTLRYSHITAPLSDYDYTESSPGQPGYVTYHFSIINDSNDAYFNNNYSICSRTIHWTGSWSLAAGSSVPRYVERGQSVTFSHDLKNNGPYDSDELSRYVHYTNYDYSNINGGNTGGSTGPASTITIPAYTTVNYQENLNTDSATPLGTFYCQSIVGSPGSSSGGDVEGTPTCTKVVGGTTDVSTSATPANVEPTMTSAMAVTLTTSGFVGEPTYPGYDINCTYSINATYPDGSVHPVKGATSCNQRINGNGAVTAATYNYVANDPVGSHVCITADISSTNVNSDFVGTATSTSCTDVITKPYVNAYGADVSAGNAFSPGGCNLSASVMGWNKGGPSYFGAGAEMAVFAQDQILGLPSGQGSGAAPSKLSFANATTNLGAQLYGGDLGGCSPMADYYGSKPSTALPAWTSIAQANADASGTPGPHEYEAAGPITLDSGGVALANGTSAKLYVDGDVYINKSITAASGAADIEHVPNFTLIARGNIYVDPSVTQLYGTYVAQPNGASGGKIYDCSGQTTRYNSGDTNFVDTGYYSACANQLVVTGSFSANKIFLLRTKGSLVYNTSQAAPGGSGYQNAAEIFKYNPLVWGLTSTTTSVGGGSTSGTLTYDAVTSLPPVL